MTQIKMIFRIKSQCEEYENFKLLKTFKHLLEKLITSDLLTFFEICRIPIIPS